MATAEPALKERTLFRQQACIDGQWVGADSGATQAVHNPADGSVVGQVPRMGAAEACRAIAAAARALPAWSALTAAARAGLLRRWFELILQHQDDLARLMTLEQGKPLAEARGEIAYAASFIEWFAEEGKRAYGDVLPAHQTDKRLLVIRQPVGVTAAITPWNFPAAMLTRKAGAALAAGCTMVARPASQTPFSALALMALAEQAGIPPGVLNVLTGEAAAIGDEFCSNPAVRKLSFTGSTEVGRQLLAKCAPDIKKVTLELGGNAPFIVFDDADLEAAVQGALVAKFRNNGQTCVCANRFYVQEGIYEAFTARLTEAVRALVTGNGLQEGVSTGPLINAAALRKVQQHVDDALAHGAVVATGGMSHSLGGNFFQPTVLRDVAEAALLTREETFGPVAALLRFTSEAEVLARANDTAFGLAAYFYTRDVGRVFRVSEALQCGMVGVNTGLISTELAPFGGIKESGLGREGSKYGLDDYLEKKYICLCVE